MIIRQNWLDVKAHLDYRLRVLQNDKKTVKNARMCLKHFLTWADSTPFPKADRLNLTYPEYLLKVRFDDHELSPSYMKKSLNVAREFLVWAKLRLSAYKGIPDMWMDSLRVRRSKGTQSKLAVRSVYSLEDVLKIIQVDTSNRNTLRFKRDKAAVAFLFLSGMRIGAFLTLPLDCVDIERRRIEQLPEKGVQTKNSKAAITFLLPIKPLMEVVTEWDSFIRVDCDDRSAWYASLGHEGQSLKPYSIREGVSFEGRRMAFTQGLKELCVLAGVPFRSPHKLRHGFGVYAVKNAKNMAQLKAVSQNLMHSNVGITDGIYSRLPEDDVFNIISELGNEC